MADREHKYLTKDQVSQFLEKGYLKIPHAFTEEKAKEYTDDMWIRLGLDPKDRSTWPSNRIHMPKIRWESAKTFSPIAWGAMCELLGGEDRVDPNSALWGDGFILNLGTDADGKSNDPKKLENWHADGDFFIHYLDSPEQALLVIPIFSQIKPGGGGTFIATDGIGAIARRLLAVPQGIRPGLHNADDSFNFSDRLAECKDFVELTGDIGDVILMHPLMLHTASYNLLGTPRIITNPAVSVKEPFQFNRADPNDFSLVELKTLRDLGVERLDFKAGGPRTRVTPGRASLKEQMKAQELQRLREHAVKNGKPVPAVCVQ